MTEDWTAVAKAINTRVHQLGWQQKELAERSHVSQAIVREIQHHTIERRRSARTLEALSTTLGWHPQHLAAVLNGRTPPTADEAAFRDDSAQFRLDAIEERLDAITDRLDDLKNDLTTVINHVRRDR